MAAITASMDQSVIRNVQRIATWGSVIGKQDSVKVDAMAVIMDWIAVTSVRLHAWSLVNRALAFVLMAVSVGIMERDVSTVVLMHVLPVVIRSLAPVILARTDFSDHHATCPVQGVIDVINLRGLVSLDVTMACLEKIAMKFVLVIASSPNATGSRGFVCMTAARGITAQSVKTFVQQIVWLNLVTG